MNSNLRAIIVEDEPLAREGLQSYMKEVSFLDLIEVCDNALEANQALLKHRPDLMFLDIQMPKITGIDFLKSLSKPPLVIFTTAYPHYALQGFDLDVVDYLVKPYPFDRFLKAVNKAWELHQYQNTTSSLPDVRDHFFVKTNNKMERVIFQDILYVEAMENYIYIHTHQARLLTLMTMKAMEALLPPQGYLRVHKSYIIALSKVQSIEGNEIIIDGKNIPISRQKRKETLDRLIGNWS